ncbi:MAG: hypothetical protein JW737_00945 [Acidobacteria bacterium]|nr:hypothetical protein [Acidobacteriota bacterium]
MRYKQLAFLIIIGLLFLQPSSINCETGQQKNLKLKKNQIKFFKPVQIRTSTITGAFQKYEPVEIHTGVIVGWMQKFDEVTIHTTAIVGWMNQFSPVEIHTGTIVGHMSQFQPKVIRTGTIVGHIKPQITFQPVQPVVKNK